MDPKATDVAKAEAAVTEALREPDKAISDAIKAIARFKAIGLEAVEKAGIPAPLVAAPLMYVTRAEQHLERANRSMAWVHSSLHEAAERLNPDYQKAGGGGGKGDPPPED